MESKHKTAPEGWIITIKATGEAAKEPYTPQASLAQLQKSVGGYIELVSLRGALSRYDCFCNDEGNINGLPVNWVVSALYGRDAVCGDCAICAHDEEGETLGLADGEVDEVLATLGDAGAVVVE